MNVEELPPDDGVPFVCAVRYVESHVKEGRCGFEPVAMISREDFDRTSEYRKMLAKNIALVYTGRIVCEAHARLLAESLEGDE